MVRNNPTVSRIDSSRLVLWLGVSRALPFEIVDFVCRVSGINCTPPAIEDFPHDLFDEKQRQDGAVVVHVIVSLYLFIALAVVCDKFFVPAVEKICHGKANCSFIPSYKL